MERHPDLLADAEREADALMNRNPPDQDPGREIEHAVAGVGTVRLPGVVGFKFRPEIFAEAILEVWYSTPPTSPARVALARVRGKVVAVSQPAAHLTLAPAAGVLQRLRRHRADVATFQLPDEFDSTLLMAGCDPAAAILADWLARRRSPVHAVAVPCSSRDALRALVDGRAHVAGVHLRDQKSGEYNIAPIRRALGHRRSIIVNFARWELGLATAPGNPLAIRGFADLERPGLRIVNREDGSGARSALDQSLGELGIPSERISGYQFEVGGHLEVAAAIAAGLADAGVTIRLGADAYGLHFLPHRDERYDLVIMEQETESAPIKAMLDALNSRRFAREISQLCAYDTGQMGQVVRA